MGGNATEANANRTATLLTLGHVTAGTPTGSHVAGDHRPTLPTAIAHRHDEQHPAGHTTTPAAGDPCRSSLAHRPTLPTENVTKMTYEKRNETRPPAVSY